MEPHNQLSTDLQSSHFCIQIPVFPVGNVLHIKMSWPTQQYNVSRCIEEDDGFYQMCYINSWQPNYILLQNY